MSIASESKVGQVAAEYPLATRVFARYGIDFCCGGGRPLEEVCRAKGLETQAVLDEIQRELAAPGVDTRRWDEAPLEDLIDHILISFHRPLRDELPRLEALARRVLDAHRDRDGKRLSELLTAYVGLKDELEEHMAKEEQILFPMVRRGQGATADGPVSVMLHEHDDTATALRRLRVLTDDYRLPADACNSWRALWHGLAALEESLHQHIHLENNILFPRALRS